eukprot:7204756-Prymnesium_polylepis.1
MLSRAVPLSETALAAGCQLRHSNGGRSEWVFAGPKIERSLDDLVAEFVPRDTGIKKATALLQAKAAPGVDLSTRAVREALSRRDASPAACADGGGTGGTGGTGGVITLREFVGKGTGVVATRAITKGTVILKEAPLLKWSVKAGAAVQSHAAMDAALKGLLSGVSEADQATFWGLCQNAKYGTEQKCAHGVWLSNAWPIDGTEDGASSAQARAAAVFRWASRFNHSCRPNAWAAWDDRLGQQTVHAVADIAAGQEICVCYLGIPKGDFTRNGRRSSLASEFGFVCACDLCSLDGEALRKSDLRQRRIHDLYRKIISAVNENQMADKMSYAMQRQAGGTPPPTLALRLINERLTLMGEDTLATPPPRGYSNVARQNGP